MDSEVYKWLSVSLNTNVIYETRRTTDENNAYTSTVFSALTSDPITPAFRNNLIDIPDFLYNRIMNRLILFLNIPVFCILINLIHWPKQIGKAKTDGRDYS